MSQCVHVVYDKKIPFHFSPELFFLRLCLYLSPSLSRFVTCVFFDFSFPPYCLFIPSLYVCVLSLPSTLSISSMVCLPSFSAVSVTKFNSWDKSREFVLHVVQADNLMVNVVRRFLRVVAQVVILSRISPAKFV